MTKVAFHWSGGKDSTLALSRLLARDDVQVERLITTTDPHGTASTVHDIPVELIELQARRIGIDLQTVPLRGDNLDGYSDAMHAVAADLQRTGANAVAFGDLDVSGGIEHRSAMFEPYGIEVIEPLAGMSSQDCVETFLRSGHRALVVVVNASVLGPADTGVPLDDAFLKRLPEAADPNGEFGEYHTFTYDSPLFSSAIKLSLSEPRHLERRIRTTEGTQRFTYWVSTPGVVPELDA